MKRTLLTTSAVVSMILLHSCVRQPIFYHSEASLPYYHSSTKTVFELIIDANATNTFQFGVIAAKDNDTLSYVVLAPSKVVQSVKELRDVNLNYSIPLLSSQVKEFIKILDSSAEEWNTKYDDKNGINYEFMVSPENRIIPQSENVFLWYPTIRFYFQNNQSGPLGSILFGEGSLQYYYRIVKASAIRDLASMLRLAIKE